MPLLSFLLPASSPRPPIEAFFRQHRPLTQTPLFSHSQTPLSLHKLTPPSSHTDTAVLTQTSLSSHKDTTVLTQTHTNVLTHRHHCSYTDIIVLTQRHHCPYTNAHHCPHTKTSLSTHRYQCPYTNTQRHIYKQTPLSSQTYTQMSSYTHIQTPLSSYTRHANECMHGRSHRLIPKFAVTALSLLFRIACLISLKLLLRARMARDRKIPGTQCGKKSEDPRHTMWERRGENTFWPLCQRVWLTS